VSKKTEKSIKPRKSKKKKPIKILKKPADSVRFHKQKTKKTEPNRKKQKKTEPNQAKTGKTEPKPEKTEPNRFEPVFALKNPNRSV
jgi:hypothetical protein